MRESEITHSMKLYSYANIGVAEKKKHASASFKRGVERPDAVCQSQNIIGMARDQTRNSSVPVRERKRKEALFARANVILE